MTWKTFWLSLAKTAKKISSWQSKLILGLFYFSALLPYKLANLNEPATNKKNSNWQKPFPLPKTLSQMGKQY